MQKQYYFSKKNFNEKGFLFPYIAFIATLLLLATVTSITLLENNRKMTDYQIEQIEMETLRQMASSSLQKDLKNQAMTLPFLSQSYLLPNGEAIIYYKSHTEEMLYITIKTITTNDSEQLWSISIPLIPNTTPN
ncbi:hypothetical protein [Paraliobacillus sp. JSM ZJ581]|uniref:hypothetical protein n=1 Tax=Paraliobacillus sp. JSM ZJ581 TaxID=3342118 RepID=UPI0035A827AE